MELNRELPDIRRPLGCSLFHRSKNSNVKRTRVNHVAAPTSRERKVFFRIGPSRQPATVSHVATPFGDVWIIEASLRWHKIAVVAGPPLVISSNGGP